MDTRSCDAGRSELKHSIEKIQDDIVEIKVELGTISATQTQISSILDKQEKNLELHMARTAQNEFMIDELKQQTADIAAMLKVLENDRQQQIGAEEAKAKIRRRNIKILGVIGTIVGILAGIATILSSYGII